MFVNHPSLLYKLTPSFRGISQTSEYKTSIRINSLGLREDKEYERKAPGVYRILAIGDSFTMGVGVELEDTYLKVLERMLESRGGGQAYEVINAGVPGYNTRQELTYLQEEGLKLAPDLVLLNFYVGNDIYDNFYSQSLSVIDGYLQNGPPPKGILPYKLRSYLARNSHFYNFIWLYQRRLFDWSIEKREKQEMERYLSIYALQEDEIVIEMNVTQEQLKNLANLAKRFSFKLLIVVIPEPIQVDLQKWVEVVQHVGKKGLDYQLDNPNKRIVEFCNKLGVPVLDLLPVFTQTQHGERLYFELDRHWTLRGNALAAEVVQAFLRDQKLIPIDSPEKREAAIGVQR
jgi:lysophospholipase L1-like esterase